MGEQADVVARRRGRDRARALAHRGLGARRELDPDHALRRVGLDGAVTTLVTEDADGALEAPNHVAVGPDGDVFFSDPCKGRVYRADQETGAISGVITMELPTQGGPNGIALDASR